MIFKTAAYFFCHMQNLNSGYSTLALNALKPSDGHMHMQVCVCFFFSFFFINNTVCTFDPDLTTSSNQYVFTLLLPGLVCVGGCLFDGIIAMCCVCKPHPSNH